MELEAMMGTGLEGALWGEALGRGGVGVLSPSPVMSDFDDDDDGAFETFYDEDEDEDEDTFDSGFMDDDEDVDEEANLDEEEEDEEL